MTNEFIYVTGLNGEVYEVCPTEALSRFFARLAEEEIISERLYTTDLLKTFALSSEEAELSCALRKA